MKFLKMGLVLCAFAAAGALTGCDSNPYSDNANITPTKPPVPEPKPEPTKSYSLEVPFAVTCNAGIECRFSVTYGVTNDDPVLTFENLPAGAVFDEDSNQVKWTPTPEQVSNDIYIVSVSLRGNADEEIHMQKAVAVTVRAVVP